MYETVIHIHIFVSSVFFLLGAIVLVWALFGWIKDKVAGRNFKRLSIAFVVVLYLQLITGITLYFFLKPQAQAAGISLEEAMEQDSLRFWAIEHVSLMLFALILAQIGRLLIKQMSTDKRIFRATVFYFGISFLAVLGSATIAFLR